jgi:hypothetical protein
MGRGSRMIRAEACADRDAAHAAPCRSVSVGLVFTPGAVAYPLWLQQSAVGQTLSQRKPTGQTFAGSAWLPRASCCGVKAHCRSCWWPLS